MSKRLRHEKPPCSTTVISSISYAHPESPSKHALPRSSWLEWLTSRARIWSSSSNAHTTPSKFKAAHSRAVRSPPLTNTNMNNAIAYTIYICNALDIISCMKNNPVIHCIFCFSINFIIFQTQTMPNRFIPTSTCSRTWRWVKRSPLTSCVYFYLYVCIKEMSQWNRERNKGKRYTTANAMASTS